MQDQQTNSIRLKEPPQETADRVLGCTGCVTMIPEIASRALEMVKDIETSVGSFADLIEQDVKLATDILSMANSALYSPGQATSSLPQAISRLGFDQCKNLIIASSVHSALNSMELDEEWTKVVLTQHSILTGTIASCLNRNLGLGFAGEEFAAGLLHDFGRILLAASFRQQFSDFDQLDFDEESSLLVAEQDAVGTNHCELGSWFARTNGLPEELCDVVLYHHTPHLSKDYPLLVLLVSISDHMANHYQRFGATREYDPFANPFLYLFSELGKESIARTYVKVARDVLESSTESISD